MNSPSAQSGSPGRHHSFVSSRTQPLHKGSPASPLIRRVQPWYVEHAAAPSDPLPSVSQLAVRATSAAEFMLVSALIHLFPLCFIAVCSAHHLSNPRCSLHYGFSRPASFNLGLLYLGSQARAALRKPLCHGSAPALPTDLLHPMPCGRRCAASKRAPCPTHAFLTPCLHSLFFPSHCSNTPNSPPALVVPLPTQSWQHFPSGSGYSCQTPTSAVPRLLANLFAGACASPLPSSPALSHPLPCIYKVRVPTPACIDCATHTTQIAKSGATECTWQPMSGPGRANECC